MTAYLNGLLFDLLMFVLQDVNVLPQAIPIPWLEPECEKQQCVMAAWSKTRNNALILPQLRTSFAHNRDGII
jgi:hypothetical protein